MRNTTRVVASVLVALALTASAASAANVGRSRYVKRSGPGARVVVFLHNGSTEDSCAHARLVDYSSSRRVYRCATP